MVTSYVYEPDSYVPLARLDALGAHTSQGGLGTIDDPASDAAHGPTAPPPTAANDAQAQYWASLGQPDPRAPTSAGALTNSADAKLCNVYYFHTDQVGTPEELSNSEGQLVWQASYKTWGATVAEEWTVQTLAGQRPVEEGDKPHSEQNLRFQGQYLDRDTGLHYNTFRFYDPDMGRFICPDPIGLAGGLNLGSYAPNPLAWIDPWGWCPQTNPRRKRGPKTDPNAPHNKKIRETADKLEEDGNIIIAGGGRKPEVLISTPGGNKNGRRPDIIYETPSGERKGVNVGKTKADGTPVKREESALEDLNNKAELPTIFVEY